MNRLLRISASMPSLGNEPFGSRSEPASDPIAVIRHSLPGEIPEGRARVHPIGHSAHPRKRI